ncbi:hypothetical protein [Pseudochrobactrum sp. MP213Fo]|uniref:hypothetical protein n=1 Tax=Pseudochrobactrum sp. MP213Fo TaxID=3022250 RepID=UPI003BA060E2
MRDETQTLRDQAETFKDSAASSDASAASHDSSAAASAAAAATVLNNLDGGTTGQMLVKRSNADYDYEFTTPASGGDMFKSVFDPKGKDADAFDMANMDEAANALILRSDERTAISDNTSARHSHSNKPVLDAITASFTIADKTSIDANTSARHSHSNKAVLDATTASFLTADKTKLNGIAAGATASTGTVTSVAVAVPTGFTVTPAITTSGTITISYASGYQGYTTAEANKLAGIAAGADKTPALATVATSGSYNDLGNKPVIPAAQIQTDWNATSGVASIKDKPASFPPSAHTHTPVQVGLSNVANKSEAQMVAGGAIADGLAAKLDKTAQAGDSAKLGNKTAAAWQAEIDAGKWPGIYSGGVPDNLSFPIGTVIGCYGPAKPRNSIIVPCISNSVATFYYKGESAARSELSGLWSAAGAISSNGNICVRIG